MLERFWKKINKTETCWLWIAAKDHAGYGKFFAYGKLRPAHRFSYELAKGPIPAGLTIDHLCRVPACVNPEHLEAVTIQVNNGRSLKAMQTHCIHGHEFTDANTYRKRNGTRACKQCHKDRNRAHSEAIKSSRAPSAHTLR